MWRVRRFVRSVGRRNLRWRLLREERLWLRLAAILGWRRMWPGCCATSRCWITGLIFYLIDKRPFVRFHAAQSLVLFGAILVAYIVLAMLAAGSIFGGWLAMLLSVLIYGVIWGLGSIILWILCMVKAYQGVKFKLPVVGDIAEKMAGNA